MSGKTYKTAIFDFDGTIADTFGVFYSILRQLGPQIGVGQITPEDILEYRQKGVGELIKHFKIKAWKIPFLVKKGQKIFGEHIEETSPFENMPETLRLIFEANIKLGIITTNTKKNVDKFLKKWDLNIFDFVISVSSLFGKTISLRKVLKKYKLDSEETIYIGDEIRDILSAKAAGVDSGAVTWGYNSAEVLKKQDPDIIFEHPKDLEDIIRI